MPTKASHPNHDFSQDVQHISDLPVQDFIDIHNHASIAETLSSIPQIFRRDLLDQYEHIYAEYQRNPQISENKSRFNANQFFLDIRNYSKGQRFLNQSDDSLRAKAKHYALTIARLMNDNNYPAGCYFATACGVEIPHKNYQNLLTQWKNALALQQKAELSGQYNTENQQQIAQLDQQWQPIKARLLNDQWWIRQLIKKHDRQFEQMAIRLGKVNKHREVYVSDQTLSRIVSRQQRSLQMMQHLIAVSDQGDELEMLDIIKTSPANPAVRRAELMNRLYGFEQYADQHKHIAEFYTLTAPSKYHPNSRKYNHWTPRQTQQQYFSPLWARIRAKFKHKDLSVYGFRIAEPHGDACPHWHILLFMPKAAHRSVRQILRDYALREDGNESGAETHRFTYKTMSKDEGSAISYMAKYISKNVDGFGMENETDKESGQPINEVAKRVRAWASVWGIRQFQQIGGSYISVWRELRRLDKKQSNTTIETARKAADSSDWKAYLEAQGGTNTPLKDQTIQLYHQIRHDENTGELYSNQYGERVSTIKGIVTKGYQVETRLKQWSIQAKTEPHNTENQDVVLAGVEKLDIATALAFDLPWSTVNNCRNTKSKPICEKDFLAKELEIEYKKRLKAGEKFDIDCKTFVKNLLKKV